MKVKLKFTYPQTGGSRYGENIDSRNLLPYINLSEVIELTYGEEKEEVLTGMKTVKQGMAETKLCETFIMVYCCGMASISKSVFSYFQCDANQKIINVLL